MSLDPYQVLGISRAANQDQVRQAYRRLARRFHPDVNSSSQAEERFKEVTQAFSILSNVRRRELFDEFGEDSLRLQFDPAQARRNRARPAPTRAGPRQQHPDVLLPLEISLGQAIRGGALQVTSPVGNTRVVVNIPPGTRGGAQIRLPGRGRPGHLGASPGDLLVQVTVRENPHFRRQGDQLHLVLPVTILEALGGASVQIPAPRGLLRVQVPPGTRGGERLRIRGQGLPTVGGGHGDLFVQLSVRLPEMDPAAHRFLKQLAGFYRQDVRRNLDL